MHSILAPSSRACLDCGRNMPRRSLSSAKWCRDRCLVAGGEGFLWCLWCLGLGGGGRVCAAVMHCIISCACNVRPRAYLLSLFYFILFFFICFIIILFFLLWHCWLGVRKSIIRPVKKFSDEVSGVGVVICLERGADCLHMVQLNKRVGAALSTICTDQ